MDGLRVDESLALRDAKSIFVRMMRAMTRADKEQFLSYVENEWDPRGCYDSSSPERQVLSEREVEIPLMIKMIIFDIKARVPFEAILPSENIKPPEKGENADCDPVATVHVDGFLYKDDEVETLMDTGKLQNNYCGDCGSKNIKPCVIISHSASYSTMEYVFRNLLPGLSGKTVLDVGSRLGAVLYSAYVLTTAKKIIGVEMNRELCDLQSDMIEKYNMGDRVEVLNKRIEHCAELIQSSDVIIINNAFEFYVPESEHSEIWKFLRANTRKGSFLVTRPQIEETLKNLNTDIVQDEWVKHYVKQEEDRIQEGAGNGNVIPDSLDYPDIACYEVL